MGAQTPELFGDGNGKTADNFGRDSAFKDVYGNLSSGDISTFIDSLRKSNDSDPTCSGALARMQITNTEAAPAAGQNTGDTAPPPTGDARQKPSQIDEESPKGFFQALRHNVIDQALKSETQKVLKGLGSPEWSDREAFQRMAEKLPVTALKHLRAGLTDENPEVRMRTESAIRFINNKNLKNCLAPMKAASDGFTDLLNNLDNKSDETRKKFENQLKLVDSLNLSREELDAAYHHFQMPVARDERYLSSLLERSSLTGDPESMRTQARLWYAGWLAHEGSPQDKEKAVSLLQEAVKTNKWQNYPRWIIRIVDSIGGPDKLPPDIKTAYEDSKKRYQRDTERRSSQDFPDPASGRRSDQDSTSGVKNR